VCTLYLSLFALYDPRLLLAVLCAVAIIFGGVWCATKPDRGRVVALGGVMGLLPLCFLWIVDMVPEHNRLNSTLDFAIVGTYLALLGFGLFFPGSYRYSWIAFGLVICSAFATYAFTYTNRVAQGEYDRPTLECFIWDPEPTHDLIIANIFETGGKQELAELLGNAGIRGTVEQSGWGDTASGRNRLIVLAQAPPPPNTKLFFPKQGSLIYAFDGAQWTKFPPDAATFPLYASFKDDVGNSMICGTRPDGGEVCYAGLNWNRRRRMTPP